MYPETVHFEPVVPGKSGVLLEWSISNDSRVVHVDLWVSPEAVAPDESEAFYRGDLRRRMRCFRFAPECRAFTDPDSGQARWYTLFGVLDSGDLIALPFERRPLDGLAALPPEARDGSAPLTGSMSRLPDPPDLVFRDDDPKARIMIRASAAAMAGG